MMTGFLLFCTRVRQLYLSTGYVSTLHPFKQKDEKTTKDRGTSWKAGFLYLSEKDGEWKGRDGIRDMGKLNGRNLERTKT